MSARTPRFGRDFDSAERTLVSKNPVRTGSAIEEALTTQGGLAMHWGGARFRYWGMSPKPANESRNVPG
jgi:hypothetical protein